MLTFAALRPLSKTAIALTGLLGFGAYLGAAPANTGLVGHFTFDAADVVKGQVLDKSSVASPGTPTGVSFEPGKFGNAGAFDGKESVIKGKATDLAQRFTIMAWVKIADLSAGQQSIYSGEVRGAPYLRVNPDGQVGFLKAEVAQFAVGNIAVKAGEWAHVAATFDNGAWALFVDGKPAGEGKVAADFASPAVYGIGRNLAGGPRPFKGLIDELRLYNRALSPREVADQAAAK